MIAARISLFNMILSVLCMISSLLFKDSPNITSGLFTTRIFNSSSSNPEETPSGRGFVAVMADVVDSSGF